MARALCCAGASKDDMVHNAYGYGLFTGGLGAHYGIERLGATAIPVSGGNSKRQINIMKDFGSTVLLSTPSYALNLAEAMDALGVDPKSLSLRVGIFGAEPWSENMREEVERKLNLKKHQLRLNIPSLPHPSLHFVSYLSFVDLFPAKIVITG